MAKYTELFAEYLESGGALPAAFANIEGFDDLFVARYCDKEIGFETEALFYIKLEERANIIIPEYVKRLAATSAAWLAVTNPKRSQTRTLTSGKQVRTFEAGVQVKTFEAGNQVKTFEGGAQKQTMEGGERVTSTKPLPLNSLTAQPQQIDKADAYTDTNSTDAYTNVDTSEAYTNVDTSDAYSNIDTNDEHIDTEKIDFDGLTPDEAIRRAEYFQKLDGTAWIILDACLREFENLFMKVY